MGVRLSSDPSLCSSARAYTEVQVLTAGLGGSIRVPTRSATPVHQRWPGTAEAVPVLQSVGSSAESRCRGRAFQPPPVAGLSAPNAVVGLRVAPPVNRETVALSQSGKLFGK